MKKLFLALFVAVFGIAAQAQDASGAVINFEQKVIDYGKVEKGADGTRVFKFKNEGTEPLTLRSVRASCGCTTPNWSREPIPPGGTGEIVVKYDTNRMGNFHKTVTVQSNASQETVVLTIRGTVANAPEKPSTPTMEGGSVIRN